MVRVTSDHALEFACRSAACRPPTSGGTGGSTKVSAGGAGSPQLAKYIAGDSGVGVRSLKVKARGGSSSVPEDRFDQEVEYEQSLRAKERARLAANPQIMQTNDSPHWKKRTAEEVGAMSEADARKLIVDNDATGRRILDKNLAPKYDGTPVGVRANLNVKKTTGITVQTMHKGTVDQLNKGTGMFGGEAIGYAAAVRLSDVNFSVNQEARAKILTGETNKFPMASVDGKFQSPDTPNGQRAEASKYNGIEVKFNPMKSHPFTDPDGRAVKSATDVTVVGSSVFVRGQIEYYTPENMPKPARDLPTEAHT